MQIAGIQKFSLSDYPGQPAAVVFTRGCNLRCPWCHNPSLVYPEQYAPLIPEEEVLSFLSTRKSKLKAVVVSGGEPTLQPDLLTFLRKLKELGFLVKLDTNGTRPEVLKEALKSKLLDCFAVDYKDEINRYPRLAKGNGSHFTWEHQLKEAVETSILLAIADARGYIRTTVVPGINIGNMSRYIEKMTGVRPGNQKWVLQRVKYSSS